MSFRQNLKQGSWAILEYLAYPLLMLASTPYFLSKLGPSNYGQWMLLLAMSGVGGLAGLGMGAATTKEISHQRGSGDLATTGYIARNSLAVALAGSATIGVLFLIVWGLVPHTWVRKLGSLSEIAIVVSFSAIIIFFEQIDAVFTGVIRGFERFDMGARIEIIVKLISVALCILSVALTSNLVALFSMLVIAAALRAAIKARVASQLVTECVWPPRWDWQLISHLFSFGKWTWAQSLGASMFAVADRLVIGSLLGAEALARFSVLTQLAQQVHTIPSAALSVVFPMISRKNACDEPIGRIVALAFVSVIVVAGLISTPLFFFGDGILTLWLGGVLPLEDKGTFFILVSAFFLLAVNIVPHYVLLGLNRARLVAATNIIAGLVSLAFCLQAVPVLGVLGGAYAKVVFGACMTMSFMLLVLLMYCQSKRADCPTTRK
jgi:O-antigen/teichoic acid export membrane protein